GVGKTTLLHIAAGLEAPDAGNVAIARGTRIGFLEQELLGAAEGTVAEHARGAATHLREIEAELRALEPELATGDAGVLERYADTQHRFEHAGGYDFDATVGRVLGGLGLAELSDRDVRTLAGGERTRPALARLLLADADLLLPRERLAAPATAPRHGWRLEAAHPAGDTVVNATPLAVGYDPPIVRTGSLRIARGARIAVVGPNGAGKTTLVRTIVGDLPALEG